MFMLRIHKETAEKWLEKFLKYVYHNSDKFQFLAGLCSTWILLDTLYILLYNANEIIKS